MASAPLASDLEFFSFARLGNLKNPGALSFLALLLLLLICINLGEALLPFTESKSKVTSPMSEPCREFETILPEDRKRNEMECPENYNGCITKVEGERIVFF